MSWLNGSELTKGAPLWLTRLVAAFGIRYSSKDLE